MNLTWKFKITVTSPIRIIKALDSAQQGAEIYSMRGGIDTKWKWDEIRKNIYPLGQVLELVAGIQRYLQASLFSFGYLVEFPPSQRVCLSVNGGGQQVAVKFSFNSCSSCMEDAVRAGPGFVLSKLSNDCFAFLSPGGSVLWASVLSEVVPS